MVIVADTSLEKQSMVAGNADDTSEKASRAGGKRERREGPLQRPPLITGT